MISRRLLLGSGAASGLAVAPLSASAAPVGPATLGEMLEEPVALGAVISPDGEMIAMVRQSVTSFRNIGMEKRQSAVILRTASDIKNGRTIGLGDVAVAKMAWANNELLLIWVHWNSGVRRLADTRLVVVKRDGKGLKYLLDQDKKIQPFQDHGDVVDMLPDDDRHIMIRLRDPTENVYGAYLVDLYDGTLTRVEKGTPKTMSWIVQGSVAVMRLDRNGDVVSVMSRDPGQERWKLVSTYFLSAMRKTPDFVILSATERPGVVIAAAVAETENYRAAYEFDLRSHTWGKRLSRRNQDVTGVLTNGNGKFLGAIYTDDKPSFDCEDPALHTAMGNLTQVFPKGSVSVVSLSRTTNRMIVHVSGPQHAGTLLYYDPRGGALNILGTMYPSLTEDRLAPTEILTVMSGGMPIRAYLTGAPGAGKPLIVLPHGGPESRDEIEFDPIAQALAAEGWLVLQVNFRGSSGYGKAFADAGRRQWNGAAMEDIEAAVDQVVASGRADPARVAVFGASFGGYAALMLGVRRPAAYRAVVSLAGPSDLTQFLTEERRAGTDSLTYKYWVKTVGDPATETERLTRSSPALRAAEMKSPVLLIHGVEDMNVRVEQSRVMARALRRANKPVQILEVKGMGHGPDGYEETTTVVRAVIDFLKPKLTPSAEHA